MPNPKKIATGLRLEEHRDTFEVLDRCGGGRCKIEGPPSSEPSKIVISIRRAPIASRFLQSTPLMALRNLPQRQTATLRGFARNLGISLIN
jgi:hypothetical protein